MLIHIIDIISIKLFSICYVCNRITSNGIFTVFSVLCNGEVAKPLGYAETFLQVSKSFQPLPTMICARV